MKAEENLRINGGSESIKNPLTLSNLNKKGLCDYVINIASGCLHGCTFCYVPSTPAIRTRQDKLENMGVNDPQLDWGKYFFIRPEIPELLEKILAHKRTWYESPSGKGVVLLCSGTDPYQNSQASALTGEIVKILLKYNKRVRILTRSPLWLNQLDMLVNDNVTVGMSIPYLDDELSRAIEPYAPPPSKRYETLKKAHAAGCRLYVAVAPTPPMMGEDDFKRHLERLLECDPEVIFWEPINARGTNGTRMKLAGLDFVDSIMTRERWANNYIRQWEAITNAATSLGCADRLHIWVDAALKGFVEEERLDYWMSRPTVEKWG